MMYLTSFLSSSHFITLKWMILIFQTICFPNGIFKFGSLWYRGIIAGGGKIKQYMGPEVNYIITSGGYDKRNFQEAKNVNSQIVFLHPSFIKDCFDENKFVSPKKQHLIIENWLFSIFQYKKRKKMTEKSLEIRNLSDKHKAEISSALFPMAGWKKVMGGIPSSRWLWFFLEKFRFSKKATKIWSHLPLRFDVTNTIVKLMGS